MSTRTASSVSRSLETAGTLAAAFAEGAGERDRNSVFPAAELDQVRASGLLGTVIPPEFGGAGGSFADAARIVSALAESDPNIAQILVPHFWGAALVLEDAWEADVSEELSRRVAEGKLRWTNGYAELSTTRHVMEYSVTLTPDGDDWLLNGKKFYCTGSLEADQMYVTAVVADTQEVRLALVPLDAPGAEVVDDWDGMGQRGTASGSTSFTDVRVPKSRVVDSSFLDRPDSVLAGVFPQLMLAGVHVGITKNALRDAIEYVRTKKRPWIHSGVERGSDDPYALLTIGEMEAWTAAADAMQERALDTVDATQANPTAESRAAAMIAVARAKTVSTDVGLRVCQAFFQVTGAASTLAKYGYDRHWRNLRTITLHDPVEYKYRLIGDYALNDRWPENSTYT